MTDGDRSSVAFGMPDFDLLASRLLPYNRAAAGNGYDGELSDRVGRRAAAESSANDDEPLHDAAEP